MKHWLAKIAGWGQFGLNLAGQLSQPGAPTPHGALQWTQLVGSLVTAVAVHAASSTDGQQ